MKRKLTAGQTSVSLPIFVQDTASTTGGGLSGLTSGTSGLVAEYRRRGQSTWTAITLTSKTLGTWTSGGFVADGALAGAYELDLPDAVCASGARWVAVRLRGAANMLPCLIEIELDVVDYLTARFGAAVAGDAMALTSSERTTLSGVIEASLVNEGDATALLQAIADKIAGDLTAGDLTALAIVSAIKADATLATMISRIDATISSRLAAGGYTAPDNTTVTAINTKLGTPAASVSADIAAVKSDTGFLLSRITSTVATLFTNLIAMVTGSGATASFTAKALELAPSGGGGSSSPPTIVTLQAVAAIKPGVIVGPSEPLVIGDDYTSTVGRQVRVNLLNSTGGSATTTFGSKSLSDAGISIQLLLRKSGQPSAVAQLVGTCTFFPAETVDSVEIPPYLLVSFSRTETAKATPGAYDMQAEAVWSSGEVVTFAPYGQVEFVRNIIRVS